MNHLVNLAKQAVETYIKERRIISSFPDLPEEFLNKQAGVFVTIENHGNLRGCIGTYLPARENIAQEIICNAIAAATEDYRFSPIKKNELSELSYTVYVLNPPELVKDIKELDPKKYGIIVKSGKIMPGSDVIFNPAPSIQIKSGLLLPGLDGIETVEQQINIACQKAGINLEREKEEITIYKFTVEKYE